MYSLLRLIDQHLKRDLRHLLLHGLIDLCEIVIQYRMDIPSHRTGRIGVIMKVEHALIFLDRMEDVKKRDILCVPGEMRAADARVHVNDPGSFQLTEGAPNDHRVDADAARDKAGSCLVLPVEHSDT